MRICLTVLALFLVAPAAASACASVKNPYAGTRYEGVDLSHITKSGTSCATARKVAKGAHRKGLGLVPPANGIRTYTWKGWSVKGDLRPASDKYVARKGGKVVRWRF